MKQVTATWQGVFLADGYNVYLKVGEGVFEKENEDLIEVETFDLGEFSEGLYESYVTAVFDSSESAPSEVEAFFVLAAPQNVAVTYDDDEEETTIAWDDVQVKDGYNVYAKLQAEAEYQKLNSALVTDTVFVTGDFVFGETYDIYVEAVYQAEAGPPSDVFTFLVTAVAAAPSGFSVEVIGPVIPEGYTAIYTPQDLQNINNALLAGAQEEKFYIANDLDFTGFGNFIPIGMASDGSSIDQFNGELHGGGHVISNLSTDAAIIGADNTYGLFRNTSGHLHKFGMENCYCRGVSGSYNAMLIGLQGGSAPLVEDLYVFNDEVNSGGDRAGGIVGYTENVNAMYRRVYVSIPILGGGTRRGGFIAWNAGVSAENCYRDSSNDGGAGPASGSGDPAGITAKNETEMKQQATFVGWDFGNVWTIEEGVSRPRLRKGQI